MKFQTFRPAGRNSECMHSLPNALFPTETLFSDRSGKTDSHVHAAANVFESAPRMSPGALCPIGPTLDAF